jgi:hypothetical protein
MLTRSSKLKNLPGTDLLVSLDDNKNKSSKNLVKKEKIGKKIKNIQFCSYCENEGHLINKCKCHTINDMDIFLKNMSILISLFPQENDILYKLLIEEYTIPQLRVLGYLYGLLYKNEKEEYEFRESLYIKYKVYGNTFLEDLKKNLIDDNCFFKFLNELQEHVLDYRIEHNDDFYTPGKIAKRLLFYINFIHINLEYFDDDEYTTALNLLMANTVNIRKYSIQTINCTKIDFSAGEECPICYERFNSENIIKTKCNHHYCINCFNNYLNSLNEKCDISPCCCYCRNEIKSIYYKNNENFDKIKVKFLLPESYQNNSSKKIIFI